MIAEMLHDVLSACISTIKDKGCWRMGGLGGGGGVGLLGVVGAEASYMLVIMCHWHYLSY